MFIFIALFFMFGIAIGVISTVLFNQFVGHQTVAIVTVQPDEADETEKLLQQVANPNAVLQSPQYNVKYVRVPK